MTRTKATCTYDGCDGDHYARGWCSKHYRRWYVHGDPSVVLSTWSDARRNATPRITGPGVECTVEGCDRDVYARGLCPMHRERVRVTGEVGPPGPIPRESRAKGRTCDLPGCDEPHSGRGWCAKHLYRATRYGDPDVGYATPAAPPTTCRHDDGCDRLVHADGWCQMHYHRIREKGDPGPVGAYVNRPSKMDPTCRAPRNDGTGECGRPTKAKGLCDTHAKRLQRRGTLAVQRVAAHT